MPTLVEVKRSSDTRLRRRVVGQMLEREVRWDPSWYSERGTLQVLFQMSDGSDEIAQGMRKLIEKTRPAVDDVVRERM